MTATPTTLHLDERMAPLFRAIGPAIRRFVYDVIGCDPERTRLFVGRCRPVIQSAGGAGTFHHHGGATISGVFFLTAPEGSGGIEFLKPWRTAIDALPTCRETPYAFATVKYGAMQDRLVLFSSDLFHRALRSEAAEGELRIVLAFDLFAATDIRVDHSGLPHLEHLKPLE